MEPTRDPSPSDCPKLVIVSPRNVASFVQQDAGLLSGRFDTELVPIRGLSSLYQLYSSVRNADAMLVWFLGRHAISALALACVFRVPAISVIGGFEVAWEDDIQYGIRPHSLRERALRWMLRRSAAIITVSEFSRSLAVRRFPELVDRMVLIHNAVDTAKFTYTPGGQRSGVLCVAALTSGSIKVKNLDRFRTIAAAMPDTPFVLIGPALDSEARDFVSTLSSNVQWRGYLKGNDLVSAYQMASVYIQLSRHESFSLSLAEAMACGCVPVISSGGALPDVGGGGRTRAG